MGYERALDLMPVLTLDVWPALVSEPDFAVVLEKNTSVVPAVHATVAHIEAKAVELSAAYPGVTAVERKLRSAENDIKRMQYLTLLAATGELDAARSELDEYAATLDPSEESRSDRRFVRQLTRWLDAGGPTPPPIEETLALLPPRPNFDRQPFSFNWSAERTKSKAERAALDAVRAQRDGKTGDQLRDLLAEEYARRGIEASAAGTTVAAGILATEEEPFARARSAFTAVRMMTSLGTGLVRLVKSGPSPVPAWARPPDRASYEVRSIDSRGKSVVELDRDADVWLREVCDTSAEPLGHILDVWLSRENGSLVAHVGQRRVGTIPAADADAFNQTLKVAQYFDEDPVLDGRLTRAPGVSRQVLEIPVPLPYGQEG